MFFFLAESKKKSSEKYILQKNKLFNIIEQGNLERWQIEYLKTKEYEINQIESVLRKKARPFEKIQKKIEFFPCLSKKNLENYSSNLSTTDKKLLDLINLCLFPEHVYY
jgi:hypothetical protein